MTMRRVHRIFDTNGASGTVVDDSTRRRSVIADQDGNTGVVCVAELTATKD